MADGPVDIQGVLAFPNDEGSRQIRFIDSGYNTLFHVPDGGNIFFTSFDDRRRLLPCRYIDDYHMQVGNETFHQLEFAEYAQRNGCVYAPEHPREGDICDTYTIYQIKDTHEIPYSFEPYAYAKRKLWIGHYQRAYRGVLAPTVTLQDLFEKHNRDSRPFAQRTRSMSVSDVVVLERNGEEKAFYVDREGFEEAPQFLKPPIRKRKRSAQER